MPGKASNPANRVLTRLNINRWIPNVVPRVDCIPRVLQELAISFLMYTMCRQCTQCVVKVHSASSMYTVSASSMYTVRRQCTQSVRRQCTQCVVNVQSASSMYTVRRQCTQSVRRQCTQCVVNVHSQCVVNVHSASSMYTASASSMYTATKPCNFIECVSTICKLQHCSLYPAWFVNCYTYKENQ